MLEGGDGQSIKRRGWSGACSTAGRLRVPRNSLMRPPADRSTASLKALFTCARATVMAPSHTDSLFGNHFTTAEMPSPSKALRAWPLFKAEVGIAKDKNGRAAIQAAGHSD
jgi:hypothetical protein